jgi:hypothetical protein
LRDTDQQDAAEVIRGLDEVDTEPDEDEQDQEEPERLSGARAEVPPGLDRLHVTLADQIRLLERGWGRTSREVLPQPDTLPGR